ncbi:MAG TPA: FHA domain-containing protein [Nitriliruptorales bacterium]|nr:FHA domain-containing protein [Nitriliruptorales bacterium]
MDAVAPQKARKVVPLPTLSARTGELAGTVFRLQEDDGTIGRRDDCTYVVPDPRVSRVHASIRKEAGAYIVTDLGSSGGTRVNGDELAGAQVLHHGDVVAFGPIEFVFEDPSAMTDSDEMTMVLDIPETTVGPKLSPRQQQVLELMAEGMTNSEIGEQLGVTERTVKAYAQELYDKLGARNRAGAVAEAAKLGLL